MARMPELNKRIELTRMPELNEVSKLARMPELNKVRKLARMPELDKVSELARTPELDKGSELAEMPKLLRVFAFAAVVPVMPLPPRLLARTFGIVAPIDLRPMAVTGIPPGDIVIALAFGLAVVVVVALIFGGGGVGVCNIVMLLRESWV